MSNFLGVVCADPEPEAESWEKGGGLLIGERASGERDNDPAVDTPECSFGLNATSIATDKALGSLPEAIASTELEGVIDCPYMLSMKNTDQRLN